MASFQQKHTTIELDSNGQVQVIEEDGLTLAIPDDNRYYDYGSGDGDGDEGIVTVALTTDVILQDVLDRASYREALEAHKGFCKTSQELTDKMVTGSDLGGDIFASLFEPVAVVNTIESMKMGYELNHQIISEITESPEYGAARLLTVDDPYNTAIMAQAYSSKIMTTLDTATINAANKIAKLAEEAQQIEEKNDQLEALKDVKPEATERIEELQAANQAKIDKITADAAKKQKSFNTPEKIKARALDIKKAMSQVVKQATCDIEALDEAVEAFETGGDEGGYSLSSFGQRGCGVSLKDKMKLANLLANNPKLAKIALMAGRMKKIAARKQQEISKEAPASIYDISLGNHLPDVVKTQFLWLGAEETEDLFYGRFLTNRLHVTVTEGMKEVGNGPLVILVDVSASMNGTRECWARALIMAFMVKCQAEKRDLAVVYFNTEVTEQYHFKGGRCTREQLLECIMTPNGGGTDFEVAMEAGLKYLDQSEFAKGDLIWITDGSSRVHDNHLAAYLQKLKSKNAAVYAVMLETQGSTLMTSLCQGHEERVTCINDLDESGGDLKALNMMFEA